ncbi:MAG: hypothetical protein AAGK97_06735, partial [Bacteroidota bacterium]
IINTSAQKISATEKWWDDLWESTFNPPSLAELAESASTTEAVALPTNNFSNFQPADPLPVPNVPVPVTGDSLPPLPDGEVVSGVQNSNLTLYAFTSAVRTIMLIALIFWLFSYGRALAESPTMAQSIHVFVKLFIPTLIALMFLSNQGNYSRQLAFGMRSMINSWSNGVLSVSLSDYTLRAAIQDQLVTYDVKQKIVSSYGACEKIKPPEVTLPSFQRPDENSGVEITDAQKANYDYLDCLDRVADLAAEEKAKAREKACTDDDICRVLRDTTEKLSTAIDVIAEAERDVRSGDGTFKETVLIGLKDALSVLGLSNPITAPIAIVTGGENGLQNLQVLKEQIKSIQNPANSILYFTQWMWVSTLEMAMYLNGLFAPMFFAISIIPGKERMINFFIIEFLTIGLAKLAYMVVIGIVAIQISMTGTGIADDTFFWTLGVFAPAVSFAFVTAGGLAAASSYKSQSVGTIAAVGGLASSGAATIAYSMARSADKRR